jgi:hypothetical protein
MIIELKVNADQLQYLSAIFEDLIESATSKMLQPTTPKANKVVTSICIDVAENITSKYNKISKKQTLFDTKKKYKLSLKYHEAHAVNILVAGKIHSESDPYRKSMAVQISNTIDRKL